MKLFTIVYSDDKKLIPSEYIFRARGWDERSFTETYLFFPTREKAQEVLDLWIKFDKHNSGIEDDAYEIVQTVALQDEATDLKALQARDKAFDDSEEIRELRQLNESIKKLLDQRKHA